MASVGILAMAPTVLTVLIANVLLLALRACAGSLGFIHSRRLFYLLDGMIVLAFLLFLILVVVRFESFG